MEGLKSNGKIRTTTKSKQRDDQKLLQKREAHRKSIRARKFEVDPDGYGPARGRTAKTREAQKKTSRATQRCPEENKKTRGYMIDKKFIKSLVNKYQARDIDGDGNKETFCNYFIGDVAYNAGCHELHHSDLPMLANKMLEVMSTSVDTWQELECDEAQIEANFGHLVIAAAKGNRHGHVALVIQGTLTWSKQFGDDVPNSANVGISNFYGKPVSYAFGKDMPPRYFKWIGRRN